MLERFSLKNIFVIIRILNEHSHYSEIINDSLCTLLASSLRNLIPGSYSGNIIEPNTLISGKGRTLKETSVTTPSVPSDPKINCWISGPPETLGTMQFLSTTPLGVTNRMCNTMSSILPYLDFFMPDALVATQPPNVLNSQESGSWPMHSPTSSNC